MTNPLDSWLPRASAQPEQPARPPLEGVSTVWVDIRMTKHTDPLSPIALERLRTVAELKLRAIGLRVLDLDDLSLPATPVVIIELIWLYRDAPGEYVYHLAVEVSEPGYTYRNPAQLANWWVPIVARRAFIGVASSVDAAATLVKTCDVFLDELINEWLRANPR